MNLARYLSLVFPFINPEARDPAAPEATTTAVAGTKYLFVFGDSYSGTGSWIGGVKPSKANPIGNPAMPGKTTSGGLNWVGYVTSKLNSSLVLTYNFARVGATVDEDIVDTWTVEQFDDQVEDLFVPYLGGKPSWAPWTATNSLAAVWVGINDLGEPFFDSQPAPIDAIMDRYFELLQTLYDTGLRQFVIFTVPPFYKTPEILPLPAENVAGLKSDIKKYNDALSQRLLRFKLVNLGVKAEIFDTAPPFETAIANPKKYGSPNATCMNSNGLSCLWHDSYHPGIYIQKLVAEALVKQVAFLK